MFADPFCDTPWAHTSRRGWATLISFAAQMLGVGVLLLLPLIYNEAIPAIRLSSLLAVPLPPAAPAPPRPHSRDTQSQSNLNGTHVVTPYIVPDHVAIIHEQAVAESVSLDETVGVPGGTGVRGSDHGIIGSVGIADPVTPPPPPVHAKPRISRMMEGNLIRRVQPLYPMAAKAARIQGPVVLRAVISKEGTIENLTVLSGHPMLVKAALEAVREWRYRPYMLNGDPFEVETQVTVNFVLN
jgi:periplasmic protein TonB